MACRWPSTTPASLNVAVELVVELRPIGDHHERPVAGLAPQDLLREEQHREALARALRVPEDAEPARRASLGSRSARDRGIDAENLVVLGEDLDQAARALEICDEVLDHVEQPRRLAERADRRFQRDHAGLGFIVDPLPLAESLPRRERRPHLRLRAGRKDD